MVRAILEWYCFPKRVEHIQYIPKLSATAYINLVLIISGVTSVMVVGRGGWKKMLPLGEPFPE